MPPDFNVELMDIQTLNPVGRVVDQVPFIIREKKQVEYFVVVVLCFATPVTVLTRDGLRLGGAGDCMIVSPTFTEYHRAADDYEGGFVNDWLHVRVKKPASFEALQLPVNELIKTGNEAFIRDTISALREEELYRRELHEHVISNLIEGMFIKLKRAYLQGESPKENSAYHERLLDLRQRMIDNPGQDWPVERMAKSLNLSASRFSVIYRGQFNVSPLEDLTLIRLNAAKWLLLNHDLKLKEIAVQCGFQNEYYFCRVFKNKVGTTPSIFRRK